MQLYGSTTSPFVRHCRIALADAGIDYELVETDHASSAKNSPTRRVPFLQTGEITLYDSTSILQYIRQQQGVAFLATPRQTDVYAMANTVLDTHINLFLLEKNSIKDKDNPYLQRQWGRIADSLQWLEKYTDCEPDLNDAHIRLACMLDWILFRQRGDLVGMPNLQAFYAKMHALALFKTTDPRG